MDDHPPAARPAAVPALPPGLSPGDRMPVLTARTRANPQFKIDAIAGRWIVLGVIGSAAAPGMAARTAAAGGEVLFDDGFASLFLVTQDAADESRLPDRLPGIRIAFDTDAAIVRAVGALRDGPQAAILPAWYVIDPGLTVQRVIPFRPDGGDVGELAAHLRGLRPPERWLGYEVPTPILILPDVFEPAFCDHLIGVYEAAGGQMSGFMRDQGGQTVAVHDPSFKVRRDYTITDPDLMRAVQARILRYVVPQIERVHFFRCTRMERYLVACYDAEEGGHFRPHRDNTTHGTAHRRYAVSINLNDDFEGGEVSFPEYSPRGFKAPRGGAVIFSCSMLHAVGRVTAGRRYAFLPFLYDDVAAQIREANAARVPTAAGYRA
jgi:predicted 2-oxoglutarate/Fe(II)-dependent dioxygenase YbiX